MKRLVLSVFAMSLLMFSKADIVVQGTHSGNSVLFGTLTVNCKTSEETCARIRTNSVIGGYDVEVPGMGDSGYFHCDDYRTSSTEEDVTVTFTNVQ